MKLTNGLEQAVCIIALLSTQEKEVPVSSKVINQMLQGSPTYLRKIFRKLVVADLVDSVPGNSGGFTLSRPPEKISLRDMVEALEGSISTYPETGVADRVFGDMQSGASSIVKPGDMVLKEAFREADNLWLAALEKSTADMLIKDALGTDSIPKVNWNDTKLDRELLVRKVMKKLNGND